MKMGKYQVEETVVGVRVQGGSGTGLLYAGLGLPLEAKVPEWAELSPLDGQDVFPLICLDRRETW